MYCLPVGDRFESSSCAVTVDPLINGPFCATPLFALYIAGAGAAGVDEPPPPPHEASNTEIETRVRDARRAAWFPRRDANCKKFNYPSLYALNVNRPLSNAGWLLFNHHKPYAG